MTIGQAAFLGAVQGLSEFLPISSSGHLIVVPWLMRWPAHSLAFDVALHVGTLVAVIYAFAGDWWRLLSAGVRGALKGRPFDEPDGRLLGLLALASVPGAVAGLLLEDWAETVFRSPGLVALTMALMGAVLFVADRRARQSTPDTPDERPVSLRDGLIIGVSQALALVPGVSRSGATISMALFLGYPRAAAARFSFLLATPITFGAAVVKVPHLVRAGERPSLVLAGILVAGALGLLAIRFLLSYVRTRSYAPFVYYRLGFAALILVVLLVRS
jgi:undecaprenyl-diphosphatase